MEIQILREEKNLPAHRLEVAFSCLHKEDGTPSRQSLLDALASKLGAERDRIALVKASTKTGTHETRGVAHVYDSRERLSMVEPRHILERGVKKKPEEGKVGGAPEKKD